MLSKTSHEGNASTAPAKSCNRKPPYSLSINLHNTTGILAYLKWKIGLRAEEHSQRSAVKGVDEDEEIPPRIGHDLKAHELLVLGRKEGGNDAQEDDDAGGDEDGDPGLLGEGPDEEAGVEVLPLWVEAHQRPVGGVGRVVDNLKQIKAIKMFNCAHFFNQRSTQLFSLVNMDGIAVSMFKYTWKNWVT